MKKLKESKPDVPLTGTVVKCSKERLIRKNYTQFYTCLWNPQVPPILVKKSLSEKYSTFFCFLFQKNILPLHPQLGNNTIFPQQNGNHHYLGEMVEWSITAVLKTAVLRGTGGSNPSLSANKGVNQQVMRFAPFITPKNLQTIKNAPKTVFDNQE